MHIVYDSTAFLQNNVGGVARYFTELANRIDSLRNPGDPTATVLAGLNGSHVTKDDFRPGVFFGWRMPTFRGSWRAYKLINDLMTQGILLCHGNDPVVLHETYYGAPATWNRRVRRVITIHDMIWEDEEFAGADNWVRRAKKQSALRADGIIFVSESTRAAYRRHHAPRCREAVIHHGGELRTTRARQRVDLPWPYILFVGRREFYKNWARFIDAVGRKRLWETHGLVHVGDTLKSSEWATLETAGVPRGRVRTVRCDDDGLADLYAAADCFVFPSLVEGFGIPLLEAAQLGCPIACSDIPVFREVLPEGAAYFDPRCSDGIATAIEKCLIGGRSSPTVETLRARAALFSWQKTAQETLRFYESLF